MLREETMIDLLGVLRMVQIGEKPEVQELEELIGILTDELGYIATVNPRLRGVGEEEIQLREFLQEQITEAKIRRVCSLMGLTIREEKRVMEEIQEVGIDDYHRMTVDEIVYDIENFMTVIDFE